MKKITTPMIVDAIPVGLFDQRQTLHAVVDVVLAIIRAQLCSGNAVVLKKIGTLTPRIKPARTGRHPATGATAQFPPKGACKFTAFPKLREEISQSRHLIKKMPRLGTIQASAKE